MKETKDHFIKKPFYPGGPKAMSEFIQSKIKYPEEALENKIEGTVYIKYDVDYRGKVSNAQVKKALGHGCDEEAIRIVEMMKFEVPKNPRKLKLKFHKSVKINFKLPVIKKKPTKSPSKKPAMNISYNIVTSSAKPAVNKQVNQPRKTHSYTISITKK